MRITLFIIMTVLVDISRALSETTQEIPERIMWFLVAVFILCFVQDIKEILK